MPRSFLFWLSLMLGVAGLFALTHLLTGQAALEIYRQRLAKRPAQKAWLEREIAWVNKNRTDRVLWVGQVRDFAWKRPDTGPAELIGLMLTGQKTLGGGALKKDFKSLRLNLNAASFEGMGQPMTGEPWAFSIERQEGYNIVRSAMRVK